MGLETANYIPELVASNPVGATDPKSEGDDHLRMLKVVLQSQFVNFQSTTVSPKPVTLTEDQINDAALKSATNMFDGTNTFNVETQLAGNARLINASPRLFWRETDVGADAKSWRIIANGSTLSFDAMNDAESVVESWLQVPRTGLNVDSVKIKTNGGLDVAQFVSRASGSLQIADSGGTFGNVAAVHKAQTFAQSQNMPQINFYGSASSIRTTSDTESLAILGGTSFDSSLSPVLRMFGQNYPGTPNRVQLTTPVGGEIQFSAEGTAITAAEVVSRANGSLLVYDRLGVTKKAGFRNPTAETYSSGAVTPTQDQEGKILYIEGIATGPTLNQLEANTTMRIRNNKASGDLTLTQGTGVTLRWVQGGQQTDGNRTLAAGSIAELYWRTSTIVEVFGNGIT